MATVRPRRKLTEDVKKKGAFFITPATLSLQLASPPPSLLGRARVILKYGSLFMYSVLDTPTKLLYLVYVVLLLGINAIRAKVLVGPTGTINVSLGLGRELARNDV